jgi:flagellar biosynthesis protein FlhA
VQGDAVAGLLITGINLVGGLVVGVASGLSVGEAAETFSVLSIGDALVSQIPALLISTAAGVVVTRSATGEQLGKALTTQLLGSRQAVVLTAGSLALFGALPGMPAWPFWAMAAGLGYVAWKKGQEQSAATPRSEPSESGGGAPGSTEDVESVLSVDVLALEVGYELVSLVDPSLGGTLVDRIALLRRQFAEELGFVIPPVRLRDNLSLEPNSYSVVLLGTEVGRGDLKAGCLLALRPSDGIPEIEGEPTRDPAFGTPGKWIRPRDREISEALGYAVVDPTTILATHLSELVRRHAIDLLGRTELKHLLDVYARTDPKTVEDLVPNLLSMSDVLRVMRNLLRSQVSIRDLRTVLETLVEAAPSTKDTEQLTELVRQRLCRQLTAKHLGPDGAVSALVLAPDVESVLLRSLREIAEGTGGALAPEQLQALTTSLTKASEEQEAKGREAVLVTRADLRRFVSAFVEQKSIPMTVLSFREIEPTVMIRPVGTVSLAIA